MLGQKVLRSGWVLFDTHLDDDNDDKIQSFIISDFIVDSIADTQQAERLQVLQLSNDSGGKERNGEDTGGVGIRVDTDMVYRYVL